MVIVYGHNFGSLRKTITINHLAVTSASSERWLRMPNPGIVGKISCIN